MYILTYRWKLKWDEAMEMYFDAGNQSVDPESFQFKSNLQGQYSPISCYQVIAIACDNA